MGSSSAGADWALISISVWNSDTTGYQETINCVVRDDGDFTVDGSQFTSWPTSRQVDIRFSYAFESTGTMPWDNTNSKMVGMYAIYGATISY